jgi:predicted metal-dependent peptidase
MKNTSNNCSLSESELIQLKKDICKELSLARRDLLAFYPFIGSIALRMDLIPIRDFRVRTACTDGHDVYFDISFYKSLTRDEQKFVLAHEVWHAVLLHLVRLHSRIPNIFNMATDMEVNHMLKNDGFTPPESVLLPPKELEGKCAEEIYEYLINQANSTKNKNQSNIDNNDNSNGINGQFDKHIYDNNKPQGDDNNSGDSGSDGGVGSITDEYGEVGIDSDFRPRISKDFADKMREAIVSAAQQVEKNHGSMPSHIRELVKKLTTPEINWKERLAQFVTRSFQGSQRTWVPPNRRHVHRGLYLQRSQSTKLRAIVAIDTSGSTMNDRSKFLSELNGLVESFGDYELTVICCDCDVDSCEVYSRDNPLDIKNCGFMVEGGGGTSFFPPFEHIINNQIEADVMIYCTDGYGEAPKSNPIGIPVMWVITKDGTEDFVDWGEKLKLNFTDRDVK